MIGLIGLGKMGINLAKNLQDNKYEVLGYDLEIKQECSIRQCESIEQLIDNLDKPRRFILLLPAGNATNEMIKSLATKLDIGDSILDFSNSHYKCSKENHEICKKLGIKMLDCGVSGGMFGARNGVCVAVGGEKKVFLENESLFKDISVDNGYQYVGEEGAGHYSKMVHNGIEYALMQAFAEGFTILDESEYDFNLKDISGLWKNGSIIRSYILEIIDDLLDNEQNIKLLSNEIGYNFSGNWAVKEAIDLKVPVPAMYSSVNNRFASKSNHMLTNRLISAIRNSFGGHEVSREESVE